MRGGRPGGSAGARRATRSRKPRSSQPLWWQPAVTPSPGNWITKAERSSWPGSHGHTGSTQMRAPSRPALGPSASGRCSVGTDRGLGAPSARRRLWRCREPGHGQGPPDARSAPSRRTPRSVDWGRRRRRPDRASGRVGAVAQESRHLCGWWFRRCGRCGRRYARRGPHARRRSSLGRVDHPDRRSCRQGGAERSGAVRRPATFARTASVRRRADVRRPTITDGDRAVAVRAVGAGSGRRSRPDRRRRPAVRGGRDPDRRNRRPPAGSAGAVREPDFRPATVRSPARNRGPGAAERRAGRSFGEAVVPNAADLGREDGGRTRGRLRESSRAPPDALRLRARDARGVLSRGPDLPVGALA